jgi:hypothetical protein
MERLAHPGATADELRPCRLDVGHHEIQILDRAPAAVIPLPKWMEHGSRGVICTTRQFSPAAKSASSRHFNPS